MRVSGIADSKWSRIYHIRFWNCGVEEAVLTSVSKGPNIDNSSKKFEAARNSFAVALKQSSQHDDVNGTPGR